MKLISFLIYFTFVFSLSADSLPGKVIKVTDGDTVHVLQDNHVKEKIRLAGIDTTERKQALNVYQLHSFLNGLITSSKLEISNSTNFLFPL